MNKVLVILVALMTVGTGVQLNAAGVQNVKTVAEFDSIVQKSPVVLVMLGSNMCPHCRKMMPIFNQVAQENTNAKCVFVEINDPKLLQLQDRYQVKNMPTFKVLKNGQVAGSAQGEPSKATLNALIKK